MMLRHRFSVGFVVGFAVRLAAVSGVPLGCLYLGGCGGVSDKSIQEVGGLELRRLVDDSKKKGNETSLVLIDPRHPDQFVKCHIPGAKNIRLADVPPDATVNREISKFDTIVVYGADAASAPARAMTKRLIAVDYSGVRLFVGGLEEWRALGGEVVETPPKP
ncbi:hypothetical protein PHYC_00431 [Phycisphaerales bacterium]|nr:hypothetical protein PHYC_00431 [Phycisphaerales bacterium]